MHGTNLRRFAPVWKTIICFCLLSACALAQGRGSNPPKGPVNTGTPSTSNTGPSVAPPPTFISGITTSHAEDEGKVEFKSEVVLVQLPVTVADKSGNHMLNLRKEDFEVLENGKEEKIAIFEEVVAKKAPLSAPKTSAGEFRNLAAAQGEQPRSIAVIALDTVNTPLLDQTYGRKQLLKYLAQNLDSSQVFALAVMTSRGLKVVHGLTGDAKELIEALKRVSSENPALTGVGDDAQVAAASGDVPSFDPVSFAAGNGNNLAFLNDFVSGADSQVAAFKQQAAIETTMDSFLAIAWSLSGLPGRKSVIWATGGMPFFLDSPSTLPTAPGEYLSSLYEHTMAVLNESNISIYPVDVRGLLNDMPAPQLALRTATGTTRRNAAMNEVSDRSWLTTSSHDTLRDFAAMTGGLAFYNSNDISGLFKRAVDDSSSYYLIGYYLDTKNTKPGWRQLKVRLRDKNREKETEIRTRSGFLVTNATMNPDLARSSDLVFAVSSPFDSTGLPITARWLGMTADGTMKKVQFALQLPPNSLTLGSQNLLNFDYMALAFSKDTKDKKEPTRLSKTIRGNLGDDRLALFRNQGVSFKNELELGPGEYTVRFVVRDDVTGRVGSVSAPLTVN